MPTQPRRKQSGSVPLTLALQGGGSHGAFTWGALDELLSESDIRIEAITASSGGAMSAVVLADGMLRGGPSAAADHLEQFWREVSEAVSGLPFSMGMDKMLGTIGIDLSASSVALDYLTRLFSPYQFNLFDLNPLKSIVDRLVDFDSIRNQREIELYISTTHVTSGTNRVFSTRDITLDVVMASACLPYLFKTIHIDGEPYWDGGFTGNPSLHPLLKRPQERDILLIQTVQPHADEAPTSAPDILDRATEISYSHALHKELDAVEAYNKQKPDAPVRLHHVKSGELLRSLGRASKMKTDWEFVTHLHDIGAQSMRDWLNDHAEKIGAESTLVRN